MPYSLSNLSYQDEGKTGIDNLPDISAEHLAVDLRGCGSNLSIDLAFEGREWDAAGGSVELKSPRICISVEFRWNSCIVPLQFRDSVARWDPTLGWYDCHGM